MNLKPFEIITQRERYYTGLTRKILVYVQYKNVPMEKLAATKRLLKSKHWAFRIRYRGPRLASFDRRSDYSRQSDCLKQFANRFTVYLPVQTIYPNRGQS